MKPGAVALTVNELLDLYLDGLDADQRLSPKTRHDYRVYAQTYVRKPLGNRKVRDVTPELILTWQRRLLAEGGAKDGRPLAPNTIRLARARRHLINRRSSCKYGATRPRPYAFHNGIRLRHDLIAPTALRSLL